MKPDPWLDSPWWAARWLPDIDDEVGIDRFRRVVWAVLLAGVLAFVVRGADNPPDPFLPSERPVVDEPAGS